jgi:outer membrane protein assembly factor BamA
MDATLGTINSSGSRERLSGASPGFPAIFGSRPRNRVRAAALLTALTICQVYPARAVAQETRSEAIRQEQADRQQVVTPPKPNRVEAIITRIGDLGFLEGNPRGVFPVLDSVYPGGGFAAGLEARKPFGDDGAVSVLGGYSINQFWRVQSDLELPSFAGQRAHIALTARYLDAPDVKYYGIGNDSSKDAKSQFGYTPWGGGGRLDFDVSKHFTVGGGVNYLDVETSGGKTGPSIEERFSPDDTPGLELSAFSYINSSARAEFDWRRRMGYAGSGGVYRVRFDDFYERDHDQYSFRSFEAEAIQLIPVLRANWVIALRGVATMTDIDDRDAVPYFLQPTLGGGRSLRGYPDFRFRDRHRLLMNAELRWTPARIVDMAIFYDTGKVASRSEDLNFKDLKDSYGIGMRLVGPKGYALRVEVARSLEHATRLIVTAGGGF